MQAAQQYVRSAVTAVVRVIQWPGEFRHRILYETIPYATTLARGLSQSAVDGMEDFSLRGAKGLVIMAFLGSVLWVLLCVAAFLTLLLYLFVTPSSSSVHQEFVVDLDYRLALPSYTVYPEAVASANYDVFVQMTMPETLQNERHGIACLQLVAQAKQSLEFNRTKCVMLNYRSALLKFMHTVYYSFPFIWGLKRLEQTKLLLYARSWTVKETLSNLTLTLFDRGLQVTHVFLFFERNLFGLEFSFYYYPLSTFAAVTVVAFVWLATSAAVLAVAAGYLHKRYQLAHQPSPRSKPMAMDSLGLRARSSRPLMPFFEAAGREQDRESPPSGSSTRLPG
eukprot:RCo044670